MTPSTAIHAYWDGTIPWVSSKDVKAWTVDGTTERITPRALAETRLRVCPVGSVLVVVRSGVLAHTLPVALTTIPVVINQDVKALSCKSRELNPWLAAYLRAHEREILEGNRKEGTTVQSIRVDELLDRELPLAPLPEQRRIVAQVEALLEQVNRAKARLERVTGILKRFRQAVLAAACSGELTREWREEHAGWENEAAAFRSRLTVAVPGKRPVEPAEADHNVPDGWPIVSLAAIATHLTSGSRAWSPYYQDDGFGTFVMAQNVRPMRFDQSHRQGVAPPPNDPERLRTTVHQHDILITIVGANTGDVCRVDVPVRDHFVCQSVALARLSVPGFAAFVELWLNSARHGQRLYQEWAYGEGRPHLSFDHLRSTPIAIPGQAEQSEILRRVSQLFALAEAIERRVQAATWRAEKVPQAVLAKAFSGELVPTEAELARAEGRTYETAEALLTKATAHGAHATRRLPRRSKESST